MIVPSQQAYRVRHDDAYKSDRPGDGHGKPGDPSCPKKAADDHATRVDALSVSLCFVFSLLAAFSPLLPLQIIGSALFGLAMGGGAIAWSLWVTKLAPAEKTADYMSVHTFLTGFRGIIGPQVAFLLLGGLSFVAIGRLGALMILISIAMLIPLIRRFDNIEHA